MLLRASCLALTLTVCCGGGAAEQQPEAPPTVVTEPAAQEEPVADETPPPEPAPEPEPEPVAEPAKEIPCGNATCTPPERCISVVGMRPGSHRKECWVTCGENDSCPDGMECTMIHDGPGRVCRKIDG